MTFLRRHWFDVGGVLALVVGAMLVVDWSLLNRYQALMWVNLITLFLHQLEEYRVVGTFPGMCNSALYKSTTPDRYPLNTNTAFVVNVCVGWPVYFFAAFFGERAVWLGIASLVISFGNLVAHTTLFNIKGKTWYNAGLFTSWVCFAPVIYFFLRITQADHLATASDYLIGIPLGIALNVLGIVKLIDWLKDANTAFIFPQRALLPRDRKK